MKKKRKIGKHGLKRLLATAFTFALLLGICRGGGITNAFAADGKQYTENEANSLSGLSAVRLNDDKVGLTWEAYLAEGKSVTYNVYRRVGGGDVQRIVTDLTTPAYTDVTAKKILGDMSYQVSAVIAGEEGERSAPTAVNDLTDISMTVSSVSGITVIGKANSSVKMQAVIEPKNTVDKSVTWSVDNELATIDEKGILTVGDKSGTVRVTAVSNADDTVQVSADLTIALAGNVKDNETIVEDCVDNTNPNEGITWSGAWETWAGEPDKHHGGTKTESSAGASFEYTFQGTGIEVYAEKHKNFASYDVSIDDGPPETAFLESSTDRELQALVYSKKGLANGEHKIKCTIKMWNGKTRGNLDYLKVLSPGTGGNVDKAELQEAITSCEALVEKAYDAVKWAAFKEKLDAAVTVMNKADADEKAVTDALQALNEAKGNLGEPSLPAPVVSEDKKAEVLLIESKKAAISWDAVEDAASYIIRVEEESAHLAAVQGAGSRSAAMEIKDIENTWYILSGLSPSTVYEVSIYAVNQLGEESAKAIKISIETTAVPDTTGPGPVTGIIKKAVGENSVELSWTAPADDDLGGYYIYIDNIMAEKIRDKTVNKWMMSGLTADQTYAVKIVAYDNSGNLSSPAQFGFTYNVERIIADITVTPSELEVVKGTAFEDLQLPGTATVTYRTGVNEKDVPVKWDKGSYKADTQGSYIIYGGLNTDILMENPDRLRPSVRVTVKGGTVDPEPDPTPGNAASAAGTGDDAKNTKVKTGDEAYPAVWASAALIAAAIVAIQIKRKK